MKKILVTGASGFIGRAVLNLLSLDLSYQLRAAVRYSIDYLPMGVEQIFVGNLSANTNWMQAVNGVDVVVHAAARVHIMGDFTDDSLAEYRRVNVWGTINLARQAAGAGVRRFIFISSIKVNGEKTLPCCPYTADAPPAPIDHYGISKYEAEQGLLQLGQETGMEVVIIRPVLVYGPGVQANFLSMMRWLYKGIPLPFGAIQNKRSLVSLDNLVDLVAVCIHNPSAANQIFLVSDEEDLSTPELLQRMAIHLGKPAWLLYVPKLILEGGAVLLGKSALTQRLCSSLQVDISKTKKLLSWAPPVSVDLALSKTAQCFLKRISDNNTIHYKR